MIDLGDLTWPEPRLAHALSALAAALGVRGPAGTALPFTPEMSPIELGRWVDQLSSHLGLTAEPLAPKHGELEEILAARAPMVATLEGASRGWLAVLSVHRGRALLLGPEGLVRRVPVADLLRHLRHSVEAHLQGEIEAVVKAAHIAPSRARQATQALLAERAWDEPVARVWSFRLREARGFRTELGERGLGSVIAGTFAAHAASYTLALASFWLVGRAALLGRLETAWVVAWGLLLFLQVPLIVMEREAHGAAGILLGTWLRQKLVTGILRLSPDQLRGQGIGAFVGQMMEVQVAETLALGTGFAGAVALLEIAASAAVLAWCTGGLGPLLVLCAWVPLGAWLAAQYVERRRTWARARLGMTHDLVEAMGGHRTRLANESSDRWHDADDHALSRYLELSERADRAMVLLSAVWPRGYLVLALLSMSLGFVDAGRDTAKLAVAFGTILLVFRALRRVVAGLESVAALAIAHEQVTPLLPSRRPSARPAAPIAPLRIPAAEAEVLLEARDVSFAFERRARPVLASCSLKIALRDRVLLEGDSGGGKSTLAAVLAGIREPSGGVLLSRGLDRFTLGADEWHKRVVLAPQFHDNHVFANSFLFNLLLGTSLPISPDDVRRAQAVCHDLALDDLLARMPAGLDQMVGETGWQLSHGEKSRLFIGRALLQDPDVVVLDESLAALDPQTFGRVLACLRTRARSLLLIAHP